MAWTDEEIKNLIVSYQNGKMDDVQAQEFERMVESGQIKMPPGIQVQSIAPEVETEEEQPTEAAKTTATGISGGITRGMGPILASGIAGGAAGGPVGAAGLIGLYGLSTILDLVNEVAGTKFATPSKFFEWAFDKLGVEKPDTTAERVVQSISSGTSMAAVPIAAGSMAARGATEVVRGIGQQLMRQPVAQAVSGGTGGAAQQVAAELGGGPITQFGAGVLGSALGAGASTLRGGVKKSFVPIGKMAEGELGSLAKKATKGMIGQEEAKLTLAEEAAPDPQLIGDIKRLGIEKYVQPDHITTNQVYREFQQALKSRIGSVARRDELAGLAEISNRARGLINKLGGTTDYSRLDIDVKGRLNAIQQKFLQRSDRLYEEINAEIPQNAPVAADNVMTWLESWAKDLGGTDRLPGEAGTLYRKLLTTTKEKPLLYGPGEEIIATTKIEKPLTYSYLDLKRRQLTQARVHRSGPFKEMDTGLIKKLESELMKDQQAIVEKYGLTDKFNAARSAVRNRKAIEDDLTALFGKEVDRTLLKPLRTAMTELGTGDVGSYVRFISHVPKSMRKEVTASGLETAFAKAASDGRMDFKRYANWFRAIEENSQAKNALFTNLPRGAYEDLSALARVSRGIQRAIDQRVTTGRLVDFRLANPDGVMKFVTDAAKRGLAFSTAELATSAMGIPGYGAVAGLSAAITSSLRRDPSKLQEAVVRFLGSEEFMNMVIQTSEEGERAAIRRAANSRWFKPLWSKIKQTVEETEPQRWLTVAVQQSKGIPKPEEMEQYQTTEQEPQQ